MAKVPAKTEFTLKLCRDCLSILNEAARRTKTGQKEPNAMKAGKAISEGSNDVGKLQCIAKWKSARRIKLLGDNSESTLKTALDVARSDICAADKVQALKELKGVGPGMASAILTAIDPERYTVIDVRALDALGVRGHSNYAAIYPDYLDFCIKEATKLGMKLRDLDRALWKAGAAL